MPNRLINQLSLIFSQSTPLQSALRSWSRNPLITNDSNGIAPRKRRVSQSKSCIVPVIRQSAPELKEIWDFLIINFFPTRLDLLSYQVVWSPRKQKRVLASCNIDRRKVVVATEMKEEQALRWLEAVLYHELCHAVLGKDIESSGQRRMWHGREFKSLERKHPDITHLDTWLRSGGWAKAVRANRTRVAWKLRRE